MNETFRGVRRAGRFVPSLVLAAVLTVAVIALVWLSYGAVAEWRRGADRLLQQRSEEVVTLLAIALNRDMKGAHDSVLSPFNEGALEMPLYDMADTFARGFARFPYPESFFIWRDAPRPNGTTYFFNRADRLPAWDRQKPIEPPFPVAVRENPAAVESLIRLARDIGDQRQRFAAFEASVGGVPYQVVVHLTRHTFRQRQLHGLVGFTVNLEWVSRGYFPELLQQVARIGGVEGSLSLVVLDDAQRVVASTGQPVDVSRLVHARRFPLSFIDPIVLAPGQPQRPKILQWTAAAGAPRDQSLDAATDTATRTFWLITIAALAAGLGLVLTLGAIDASTRLSLMKTEFVSSATHELKTPLAAIQLMTDTLDKGRYQSADKIREYAALLSNQAELLARLIDNLLAYASLSDVKERYLFESLSVADLVEKALERFDGRLAATGMELRVEVPRDLPHVRADRATMLQVLDNVIDNAIKYSPGAEVLTVRASAASSMVHIEVLDTGVGIPPEERARVFQKFYRGRAITTGGSGLGLAIARRVVHDHAGEIDIRPREPQGTVVDIAIPIISQRSRSWRSASWWWRMTRRLRAFSRTTWSSKGSPSSALRTADRHSKW